MFKMIIQSRQTTLWTPNLNIMDFYPIAMHHLQLLFFIRCFGFLADFLLSLLLYCSTSSSSMGPVIISPILSPLWDLDCFQHKTLDFSTITLRLGTNIYHLVTKLTGLSIFLTCLSIKFVQLFQTSPLLCNSISSLFVRPMTILATKLRFLLF